MAYKNYGYRNRYYKKRKTTKGDEAALIVVALLAAVIGLIYYWKIVLFVVLGVVFFVMAFVPISKKHEDEENRTSKEPLDVYSTQNYTGGSPTNALEDNNQAKKPFDKETWLQTKNELKKKGEEYEAYIAQHFQALDYYVIEHGKIHGKKDKGIDLIAIKRNEVLFIQCKNWKAGGKYAIRHSHIKEFIGNVTMFLAGTADYNGFDIKRVYVTSEYILDNSGKAYLNSIQEHVDYQVIPFSL